MRDLFARPARIAGSDFLRREVASRMFERLELIRVAPPAVLDAGCGEGADLALLRQRFPQALLTGLDAAPAMLAQAAQRQRNAMSAMDRLFARLRPGSAGAAGEGASLVCADFARLPLAPAALGLLWSNLALHWHPRPDQVFAEWRRVLRAEGLLMFSCFGPDTLRELRQAAGAAPALAQTLPFVDMHDLGDMLVQAGFATPVMDMEMLTLTYDQADKLLADVRALGGNPLATRRAGLATPTSRQRLFDGLAATRRGDGKYALSIEVIYGHAFCPVPQARPQGESVIRFLPRQQ
ncbi:MAG: methyltransferase protein [Paucimonas sp.]|nr:methyltransferase protein [Paucimonas sp.]